MFFFTLSEIIITDINRKPEEQYISAGENMIVGLLFTRVFRVYFLWRASETKISWCVVGSCILCQTERLIRSSALAASAQNDLRLSGREEIVINIYLSSFCSCFFFKLYNYYTVCFSYCRFRFMIYLYYYIFMILCIKTEIFLGKKSNSVKITLYFLIICSEEF